MVSRMRIFGLRLEGCGSKPMIPFWLVGPPILVYFSGEFDPWPFLDFLKQVGCLVSNPTCFPLQGFQACATPPGSNRLGLDFPLADRRPWDLVEGTSTDLGANGNIDFSFSF